MSTKKKVVKPPRRAARGESVPRTPPDSLSAYIREIARFQPLRLEQEQELARRIRQGDAEALKRLVEANLRFVVSYAKRFRGLGLSFLDLIHEGNLGLMEAGRRFDPDRNVKFISYAVWWVRQAILHALSEQSRILKLPQRLSGQMGKVQNAKSQLANELERAPTSAEIASKVDMTENQIDNVLLASAEDVSLSASLGEDGSLEFGDTLEQGLIPSVELEMIRSSLETQIRTMLDELEAKEREVLRLRFGFDGEEPRTLQEIGDALGLTRERIRQIENRAKEKLRRSREVQGLRGYLN
jgi:RNA polymerase primary sigma factor